MFNEIYKSWLEGFWIKYIADKKQITTTELNQVFATGPYAGYSVRELTNACVMFLNYTMPKIVYEDHNDTRFGDY